MNEVAQSVPDRELLTRYGCGPIRFSGRDDALYERHLIFDDVVAPAAAGPRERFEAAARSVRDVLSQRWILTDSTYDRANPKRVYYMSMEFLIGRSLANNITNLLLDPFVKEIADRKNLDPLGLIEQEPDAGLGNGGLGRLAACFLNSMATLQLPAMGYGLRYEYGIFKQTIQDGWQHEEPDNWLRRQDPWEVPRPNEAVEVKLNCSFAMQDGRLRPVAGGSCSLIGIPFDRPIVGYGGKTVNTLRLWAATAPNYFDFQEFSSGDFVGALAGTLAAELLTRVLYPDDSTSMGQGLRFVQEYFLVACSLADLVRRFRRSNADWSTFPDQVAIQLNDTHPTMAVPELMRILLDEVHLDWDRAWDLTQRTLAYTNHTLLPEALEKWPLAWFAMMLPRHLEIILEINRRFLASVRIRYPGDEQRVQRVSLVEEGAERKIRMANLAIVGSHSTNGVSAIHTGLLRTTTVKDLAEMFQERFNNKTNGVTPRRWLLLANPALAGVITTAIDDGWVSDLGRLRQLVPLADDKSFREAFRNASHEAKSRFADWLKATTGQIVDPTSIFDCQIKRIHEYKRQLLNALRIIVLYARLRDNPGLAMTPRTFFFRWQGSARLSTGQTDHKIHQQSRRHNRRRSDRARPSQGRVPPRLLRVARRAVDPRRQRLQPDLDRRLRGERYEQHEVHDEWCPDDRHARRRDDRNGRRSLRRELLPVRLDRRSGGWQPRLVQPALALRPRAGDPRRAGHDLLRSFQPLRAWRLRSAEGRAADSGRPLHASGRPHVLSRGGPEADRVVRRRRRLGAQGHPERGRLREVFQRPHDRPIRR